MGDPHLVIQAGIELLNQARAESLVDAELAVDVVKVRRHIGRLDAVFADYALGSHRRGVCGFDAYRSTPAWLAWQTGLSRGQVSRAINTGEVAELLPKLGAGWRAGRVSTSAMEAIAAARVAGHDEKLLACEAKFLDLATRGDHQGVRRAAAAFSAHARADALVRICEIALKHGAAGVRAAANVTIVVDWATFLAGGLGLIDGTFTGPLDRRDIERLLCDSTISRVITGPDSKPLDVGRAQRAFPDPQRRAIVARDGGCQWPGCEIPAGWCDVHHHQHWQHGGTTSITNGLLLCAHHHRFLHRHPDWQTTFHEQIFRVYRPDSQELHPNPWTNHQN